MNNFVCTCLQTQSTTELNQILTKNPENAQYRGAYIGEKYLCKNLGVKEGGGCLLEGGVFSGTYLHVIVVVISPHPSIVNEALVGLHCG